jgi:hypothetical protein
MRKTDIELNLGVWNGVTTLPAWPYRLVPMQYAASAGEYEDLAELVKIFAQISGLVLRTPQGVYRYLAGHHYGSTL